MLSMPKASIILGRVPAVPATQKMINGQRSDLLCVTPPYALWISKSLYVVDLTLIIKSLINQQIQLYRKCDAPCRTAT